VELFRFFELTARFHRCCGKLDSKKSQQHDHFFKLTVFSFLWLVLAELRLHVENINRLLEKKAKRCFWLLDELSLEPDF
jgi:hypothetical protein